MNIIQSKIYKLLIAGSLFGILSSCSKNIEINAPVDKLTTGFIFTDSLASVSAVMGVYSLQTKISSIEMGFLNGYVTILPGLSADELVRSSASEQFDQFAKNQIAPANTLVTSNWNNAYNVIYQCNLIIENLDKTKALSQSLKNQLGGEMRFMRALNYFYLTNEYGGIPLTTSTDYKANTQLSKADPTLVYAQVIKDLKEAQSMLTDNYPGTEKIRANRLCATALLARVYLYQKDYANAIEQATLVIDSHKYGLSALQNTFLANNIEAIMQLPPPISPFWGTGEAYNLLPIAEGYMPAFKMTDQLLNDFEPNDLRRKIWVDSSIVSGTIYYHQFKYKIKSPPLNSVKKEYNIVFRLGEQYLLRAEALAQQGNLSAAITDVDSIRHRAGLPLIADTNPEISKKDLISTIFHERRIEFFLEWGHRWFDLKRTGQATAVLGPIKGAGWQPTDVVFPIPANEILVAPNLKQNDGYTN